MRTPPPPAGNHEAPPPFLRPAHPQRRRRRSPFARIAARVVRLAPLFVAPVLAWMWIDGATFALHDVETAGSPRIPPEWIERALAPELGRNLLSLPLDRVHERLEVHPWLGRIEARKELPGTLAVEVEEKLAAAVLETADGLFFVDADGDRIAPLGPADAAGTLVRIAAGTTVTGLSPALATGEASSVRGVLDLARSLEEGACPEWSTPVLWVEVVGDDDFRLYAGELPFSILLRSQGAPERLRLLEELRPEILDRVDSIAEIDLRFENRVIVRPGPPPKPSKRTADPPDAGSSSASEEAPQQSPRSTPWDPQPKET